MFSTRKKNVRLLLGLAAASAIAGCFHHPEQKTDPVSTEPLVIDDAMQHREWPRQTSEYYGGGIVAGATRFPYVPAKTGEGADRAVYGPERSNAVLDTGAFLAQAYMLPFTYFVDRPFVKKTYHGVTMEPSYTVMPVMPADEASPREIAANTPVLTGTKATTTTTTTTTEPVATEPTGSGAVAPSETPPEARPPVVAPEPKVESTTPTEPAAPEADKSTAPPAEPKPADDANK